MTYDNVSRPAHYAGQGEIECIDFISAVLIPYQGVVAGDLQNVIKYIWRADFKGKIQDLHKALWYAKHAVNVINSQREDTNKIARAWRTALAKRNSEEEKVFVLGMKQIQKHMSVNERKCFKKVINSIVDGNLYQLVRGGLDLVSALEEWIYIYEEEKGKRGKYGMNNEIKMRMKKILCRMEDDPVQIDNYLRQLREFPDGEERINCAWDIITKVFEEDSIRQLEMSGRFPNLSNPDDGNHFDEDEDEIEDSEDENEDNSDNNDDESDEDEEDTSDEDEDDSDEEDEEDDSDSDVDDEDEEDSGDDEDDEDSDEENDSSDSDDESSEDDEDSENENESDSDNTDDEETSKKSIPKDNDDSEKVMQKIKDSMVKASPSPDVLAGVKLPLAEKTEVPVMPTPDVISIKNSSLEGIKKAKVEQTDEGVTLRIASADGDKFGNGTVYVLPADTGKEVEVRIMELRASTDENLNLARKIHEEIARSVAEERQIRDSMYELVVAYQELAKQLTDNAQQAGEIRQKLVDGTVRAERFMNEDMSRMLQQRAQEATNDFYQESKDHYNDLFKAAVRRYKQFTEAVMDFQDKIADESARRVRTIESKLGMVQKVSYGCIVLLLINLVVAILFKVF